MTCNAWNHPPDCTCGWGGVFHPPSATTALAWPTMPGSFVNPNALCPKCGEKTFFYRATNGGSVYFDALGPPWPKHPCMANGADAEIPSSTYWQAVDYLARFFVKKIPLAHFLTSDAMFTAKVLQVLAAQLSSNNYKGVVATWISELPKSMIGPAEIDLNKLNRVQVVAIATSILQHLEGRRLGPWQELCLSLARMAIQDDLYRQSLGKAGPTGVQPK